MTPAAQTMTPTDEEMVAWLDACAHGHDMGLEGRPEGMKQCGLDDEAISSWVQAARHDIAMLRAIAERLRAGRHG